jgi:Ca2+-transporting ATPase
MRRSIVEERVPVWRELARNTSRDPMLWFLLGTSIIYALLGETIEALVLSLSILPLITLDAVLHRRTSASTRGLRARLASRARVVRDGRVREVPAAGVVPGDLALVTAGDAFPADGIVIVGSDLQVDESMLSGEAYPARKRPLNESVPSASERAALRAIDTQSWGFAGTRLLTGSATLRVALTGAETLYGEIARSARAGAHARTPLQLAVGGLVRLLVVAAGLMCVALAGVRLRQGFGWADAILSAATLAVAALPEELPVVFVMFLGVGTYRLARRNALVRRSVSVENIGRVTCIASDKTGTITLGELRLAHLLGAEPMDERRLLEAAAAASRSESGDPLDDAILRACAERGLAARRRDRVATFPFTEDRRRETSVVRDAATAELVAFTKGAPELVLSLCALSESARSHWAERAAELANNAHKVIACASRALAEPWAGGEPDRGLRFEGLLAFEDPVRLGVSAALARCRAAGIRVIMVTGDHPMTALAVAREIGLGGGAPRAVSGDEVERRIAAFEPLTDFDVVVRALPAQKLALVRALQAAGEVVALTGDGVNDVPALQVADVGIAMGERGTRSAREIAAIVLLDDSFETIAAAVGEGRQLFDNLQRAFSYLLMIHIPLVITAALIPLAGYPLLYLPIHVVWLELMIHPSAILAFQEQPPRGVMPAARPRSARGMFAPREWATIASVGALVTLLIVIGYDRSLGAGREIEHSRAMALVILTTASAAATAALSGLRTSAARWMPAASIALAAALVQTPALAARIHLQPLHLDDWALAAAGGALTCTPIWIAAMTKPPRTAWTGASRVNEEARRQLRPH